MLNGIDSAAVVSCFLKSAKPVLGKARVAFRTAIAFAWALVCVAAAFAFRGHAYIFQYLPYFLSGIAAFHYRRRELGRGVFIGIAVTMGICGDLIMGGTPALAGLLTSLTIGFVTRAPRQFIFLGSISYSLYLIHEPVGRTLGSLAARRIPDISQFGIVLIALGSSILAAWLLYRLVEVPATGLASRIRYAHHPDRPDIH